MPAYEAMLIFKPDLTEENQKQVIGELEKILKENKAQVSAIQPFGRRHLAYRINKCNEGLYYLVNFSADEGILVSNLRDFCNLSENILRALIVKKDSKREKRQAHY